MELTPEERAEIQNQIVLYKAQQELATTEPEASAPAITVPKAPSDNVDSNALEQAIQEEANPSKLEKHKFKKRIRGLWNRWRTTTLDAKSLEIEKVACQIAIERAKTQQQLNEIKRQEQLAEAKHWLELNKGNLEDIGANTTSRPSMFWYGLRRGFHHITKLTNNIPRIIRNLFWVGILIVGLIILKQTHVL